MAFGQCAGDNHLVYRLPVGTKGAAVFRDDPHSPAPGNVAMATLAPFGPLPQTIEPAITATTEGMC